MNVVTLIGNLASEVEVKEIDTERRLATFRLAVDRGGGDGGADFFRIAVWNKQADACGSYLAKGSRVGIEGRLRSRSWEQEGQRRTAVEVVAHRVEFLESRGGRGGEVVPFAPAHAAARGA